MFRKAVMHVKKSMKFLIIFIIAALLIIGLIMILFKPTYAVYLHGENIGYTEDKKELQKSINEYMKNGNGDETNVAFVQINELPEYEICLLKRNIITNDSEILAEVTNQGSTYYRYYAILEGEEEKTYVSTFSEAETVVANLKEKESNNIEDIKILEKYEIEMKELTTVEVAIENLYEEKPEPVVVATTSTVTSRGYADTSSVHSSSYVSIGVDLNNPTYGTVTAGWLGYPGHRAIDIANSTGTTISAAGSGVVTYVGWNGSYGNFVAIDHGGGVTTYYAHCNTLNVSYGQSVSQGQMIATMGSTGNSTGSHLHFEVRINGVAYNPNYYI